MEKNHNLELGLSPGPWMIRKTIGPFEDLMCHLPIQEVFEYIIPEMANITLERLKKGIPVAVDDVVGHKTYTMKLGIYSSCGCFLEKGWENLVEAKGLKTGDEIGICWDTSSERFKFHLLNVASLI